MSGIFCFNYMYSMNAVNEFIFMLKIQDFPTVLWYLDNLILCHLRLTLMNVVLYYCLTVDVLRVYLNGTLKAIFFQLYLVIPNSLFIITNYIYILKCQY